MRKIKELRQKNFFQPFVIFLYSSSTETLSSFDASCKVDYESDVLHLEFDCYKFDWILRKIRVFFNGKITKENVFSPGIKPVGIFKSIEMELSIRDMNILFFEKSEKKFQFVLEYDKLDDGAVYETRLVENVYEIRKA